ncbi:DUF4184 family protein [Kitasatospora sp. NPDC089509]|uniref:DUF4184 family protein n=1 Tax=Kitasatospora sp. NPDC089509 TaxID=3364079 RepID=UPI003816E5D3
MPFTLSHPAAVLPLLRSPFSRAALVAGAVAPDLPYFVSTIGLPVSAQSWYEPFVNATTTHSVSGVPAVTLPYTLLLWGLLLAAHRPVAALLRLPVTAQPPSRTVGALLRRAGWVLLSALIGIATHLVWDSFTHVDGFVVTHVHWLNSTLVGSFSWARALQHLSTIGGLAVLAVYGWRRRDRLHAGTVLTGPVAATRRRVLLALALGALAGAVAHAWWRLTAPEARDGVPLDALVEGVLSDAAKGAGAGLIAALAVYVTAWWIRRATGGARRHRDAVPADTAA